MVGMKPREKEEGDNSDKKGKIFGTVSTIITEAAQEKEQSLEGAVVHQNGQAAESKVSLVELGDLMSKLDQIDKNLKWSEEDRQELKKKLRLNKNENLDN